MNPDAIDALKPADTDMQQECIELILHAGSAHAAFVRAIEQAHHHNFAHAHSLMDEGQRELVLASTAQTKILASNAWRTAHIDLISVHAQDHLMMAKGLESQAKELVNIYEMLSSAGILREESA